MSAAVDADERVQIDAKAQATELIAHGGHDVVQRVLLPR